jgi:hypothetical protein
MGGNMHFGATALWLIASGAAAIAGARVSVWIQAHFAPVVIYPLLLGMALGGAFAGLAYAAGLRRSRGLIGAVLLLAVCAALLEHGFFYADYRVGFERALEHASERIGFPVQNIEPQSFPEYIASRSAVEEWAIERWVANPLITATAAGMIFWYLMRPRQNVANRAK